MHPILGNLRRLTLYLLAWFPIGGLIAYVLATSGGISTGEALALAVPLALLFGFMCLSAWYSCRGTPLEQSSLTRVAGTHLLAAGLMSGCWIFCAKALGHELSRLQIYPGLDGRISKDYPLLFGIAVLLYLLAVALHYVLLALQDAQEAEARLLQAGILAREAELKALKAQVNPHFLFNSLNSISALTSSDAAKAREMCILLGDFLRRTLGLGEKSAIPFEEEMSLIRAFLAVEKIRFGPRIQMEENVDKEATDVQIPPLLLQPLVENAVGHGIANLVEGGWIRLDATCRNGTLSIVVENNYDPDAPPRRRNGVGLANVRQRLATRYGNLATFDVTHDLGHFRVALTLPAEREAQKS
jgi:two-component system, LytTR family, sensor histidine kinase AlgZ